jgi:hypothetical protein
LEGVNVARPFNHVRKIDEESEKTSKTSKPLFGMLLAFIGGLVIVIASALSVTFVFSGLGLLSTHIPATLPGLVFGILIILCAILLYFVPEKTVIVYVRARTRFGFALIILPVVNLLIGWDIAGIGFILTVIGGIVGGLLGK